MDQFRAAGEIFMRQEPHPISGFLYSEVGEGLVKVEDRENGREGLFKWDGTYIEGDLTYADPHLLTYVGGPTVPPEHDVYWPMLPLDHDGSKPALPTPEAVQAAQAAAAQMPLIVRTGPDEFKAHWNACLHRGRQLRDCSGKKAHEFRCPFHGWTWTIDGKLKHITTEWDFPNVRQDVAELPGAKIGRWGGWIFI